MASDGFICVFSSENRANNPVYPLDVFVLAEPAPLAGNSTAPAT